MIDKKCQIIKLPEIIDQRGSLSFLESNNHIPFKIKNVSLITDIPNFKLIDGFKESDVYLVCLSGSITVSVDIFNICEFFTLNNPSSGLFMPKGVSCSFSHSTKDAIALVIS